MGNQNCQLTYDEEKDCFSLRVRKDLEFMEDKKDKFFLISGLQFHLYREVLIKAIQEGRTPFTFRFLRREKKWYVQVIFTWVKDETKLTEISQVTIYFIFRKISLVLLLFCILATVGVLLAVYCYFKKQDNILEDAESKIEAFLAGDIDARITNDEEGELYRLFSIFIACLWISWDDCINIRFQY